MNYNSEVDQFADKLGDQLISFHVRAVDDGISYKLVDRRFPSGLFFEIIVTPEDFERECIDNFSAYEALLKLEVCCALGLSGIVNTSSMMN